MTLRFKPGDAVRVREGWPPGHIRTPAYLRGKRGRVLRDYGAWRNPEQLAYGQPGLPEQPLYMVQFNMHEVWTGDGEYGPADTVTADLYEHWLDPDNEAPRGPAS